MFQARTYRTWAREDDLVAFSVVVRETDLWIAARTNLEQEALLSVQRHRAVLERYIEGHSLFYSSHEPVDVEPEAPRLVKRMAQAGRIAGIGPMAAVAGAIADAVGKDLLAHSSEVIIENGGDIFLKCARKRFVGLLAGKSPFSGKLALEIQPGDTPLGVCTSSGTVGHSFSYGKADAAVALASTAALADAAATAIGNRVKTEDDIPEAVKLAAGIKGLTGTVIVKNDKIGFWGQVRIVRT